MTQDIQHFLFLYKRAFPGREHPHVTNSVNMSTGWEGDLLSLKVDYKERGRGKSQEVVLKLYYGQDGTRKARQEFNCLHHLTHVGYPVPHPLFAALDADPFGRAAVAMEKIQGDTVAHVFSESPLIGRQPLITQCCQLYVDLHALDWEALVPNPTWHRTQDVIQAWVTRARSLRDQWLPGMFEPVLAWLQEKSQEVVCERVSLLHGDFHLDNILLRNDGRLYVIDWTGPAISDYRFDLAWTLLLQYAQGETELAELMRKEYERLAGRCIKQLEFFVVAACFKRLFDIVVSLQNGASSFGMKPDAEEEMKQQTQRIQAVYLQLQEHVGCSLPEVESLFQ